MDRPCGPFADSPQSCIYGPFVLVRESAVCVFCINRKFMFVFLERIRVNLSPNSFFGFVFWFWKRIRVKLVFLCIFLVPYNIIIYAHITNVFFSYLVEGGRRGKAKIHVMPHHQLFPFQSR